MTLTLISKSARLTLALVLLTGITGCGTSHTYTRSRTADVGTEWREDSSKRSHELGVPVVKGEYLHVPVFKRQVFREHEVTETQYESKRTTDPDLPFTIATLGMLCLFGDESCFGRWGSWESDGDAVRSARATGAVRTNKTGNDSTITADVSWVGYDEDQQKLDSHATKLRGVNFIAVGLREFSESLSSRPARLDVRVSVPGAQPVTQSLWSDELELLNLQSARWTPTGVTLQ